MSAVSSRTTMTVGPYTIVSRDDDVPNDIDVQLVDGLTITKTLGEDQLWPMQETEVCSFAVYAPAHTDVDGILVGVPVDVKYATPRTSSGPGRISFQGRVTDVSVRPYKLGVVVSCTAVDYVTVELSERLVGDAPWPQETVLARLERIFLLLGWSLFVDETLYPLLFTPGYDAQVLARDIDSQPALGLVTKLLDGWSLGWTDSNDGPAPGRYVLVPTVGAFGDVLEWNLIPRLVAVTSEGDLPGVFGQTFDVGGYGVTMPTGVDRAASMIDSAFVDLGSEFAQRRGKRPNVVAVSGPWGTAGAVWTTIAATGETPESVFRLETDVTSQANGARVAAMYLPEAGGSDWYADAFLWRWYADTAQHLVDLPRIGDLVTVAPVQDRHSPIGRPWYAGILTQLVFKVSKAEPVAELTIRPQLRPALPQANGMTWQDLPVGVTWGHLNTRDTWIDYQLLRG